MTDFEVTATIADRVGWWVNLSWPEELRRMRSAIAAQIVSPPDLPSETEMGFAVRPLRWLLEVCLDGVILTSSGYLPPAMVAEAVSEFDWWPFERPPRTEADVIHLELLRRTARRLRLVRRTGRKLVTTSTGRRLLPDAGGLWHVIAPDVGAGREYDTLIGELAALRLLAGPQTSKELADAIVPIITRQGWLSGRRPISRNEVELSIHDPLRYWRLFRLLDEPDLRVVIQTHQPWTYGFTPAGRLAALSYLRSSALRGDVGS